MTLVDGAGDLLAEPAGAGRRSARRPATPRSYRAALENRLRGKIVQLLERTVGPGKVEAAVSADLDFDEVATTAELYDPQSQVVRSTQTTEEASDQEEKPGRSSRRAPPATCRPSARAADRPPGTQRAHQPDRGDGQLRDLAHRTQPDQARRSLRKLSIAVQVDGIYRDAA